MDWKLSRSSDKASSAEEQRLPHQYGRSRERDGGESLTCGRQIQQMLLHITDKIPSHPVSTKGPFREKKSERKTGKIRSSNRRKSSSPDDRASLRFLKAQCHVRSIGLSPDDQGFWRSRTSVSQVLGLSDSPEHAMRPGWAAAPCCFWYPSSLEIFVSSNTRSGSSSDSTKIRGSSWREGIGTLATPKRRRIRASADRQGLRPNRVAPRGREAEAEDSLRGETYIEDLTRTETRAAIEPVVILQLVDFHPLAVARRLHLQRHDPAVRRGGVSSLRDNSGTSEPARGEPQDVGNEQGWPGPLWAERTGGGKKTGRTGWEVEVQGGKRRE